MNKQADLDPAVLRIFASGAERAYAAAVEWIKQSAANGKAASRRKEEELIGALLPVVPYVHTTAIVAHEIKETLSDHMVSPEAAAVPAGHATCGYTDPYSARCQDCDTQIGAAVEARRLLGRWAE